MSYTYITSQDSPNFTKASDARAVFGYDRVIEGLVIHHWGDPAQNPQFANVANYLSRANGNTSAHYVCEAGKVSCLISPLDVAWHSGSAWGNARTIGIELNPRASDADYETAAELVADIRSAYGDVPIYWHSYFTATACPGVWSAERLDNLSYTKFSHPTEWGKGGSITPKTPVALPVPVVIVSPTPEVIAVPSPTTMLGDVVQTDSGKPVTEKIDYAKENSTKLDKLLALLQTLIDNITSVFKFK